MQQLFMFTWYFIVALVQGAVFIDQIQDSEY